MSDQEPGWYQASDGQWYQSPGAAPSPVEKNGTWIWVGVAVVVLLIVVAVGSIGAVALLGGSTTTLPAATPATATTEATSRPEAPPTSRAQEPNGQTDIPVGRVDNPAPIGTEVSVVDEGRDGVDDWTVKVNSAELNANDTMAAADASNRPKPGEQFVLINVTIANNSPSSVTWGSQLVLQLATPSGVKIDSVLSCKGFSPPEAIDAKEVIVSGDSLTGNVCVQAPADEAPSSMLYSAPLFGLSQEGDQRYFLLS